MTLRAGVVLAGGRASRVDGADKALFEIDGAPLLVRAVDALAGCAEIIVVGPDAGRPALPGVRWVREDPPFAGPVAALACALAHTDADEVLVLPADLPGAADAVELLSAEDLDDDGIVLVDGDGYPQWLTARYVAAALRAAVAAAQASSVRAVVSGLRLRRLPAPTSATKDIDTWDDLNQAKGSA